MPMSHVNQRRSTTKTLVYHSGALGDFITILPALRLWKANYPSEGIALLGRRSLRQPAELSGLFDEYWNVESASFLSLFSQAISKDIEPLFFGLKSAILFAKAGSPLPENFQKLGIPQIYTQEPFPTSRLPKYRYHLALFDNLLRSVPKPYFETQPLLKPSQHPLDRSLERVWGACAKNRVTIHPGSGSSIKNWPLERFVRLAETLRDDGCSVLWIAGPAERELEIPTSFAQVLNAEVADLVYLLSRCDLYIGNDSGISHCAAATNVSCIVLFGPSDPIVWRPFGTGVRVIYGNSECGPCHHSPAFQYSHNRSRKLMCDRKCLTAITVDEVYRACTEAL